MSKNEFVARHDGAANDFWLDYDKLVLATGARPVVPPIPNIHLQNIFTLHAVNDAEGVKALLAQTKAQDVVMIGGGLIGVEAVEALVQCGCRVTLVEMMPQILRMFDWEMARLVERHMESHGVKVMTNTQVTGFEGEDRVNCRFDQPGEITGRYGDSGHWCSPQRGSGTGGRPSDRRHRSY